MMKPIHAVTHGAMVYMLASTCVSVLLVIHKTVVAVPYLSGLCDTVRRNCNKPSNEEISE